MSYENAKCERTVDYQFHILEKAKAIDLLVLESSPQNVN